MPEVFALDGEGTNPTQYVGLVHGLLLVVPTNFVGAHFERFSYEVPNWQTRTLFVRFPDEGGDGAVLDPHERARISDALAT